MNLWDIKNSKAYKKIQKIYYHPEKLINKEH